MSDAWDLARRQNDIFATNVMADLMKDANKIPSWESLLDENGNLNPKYAITARPDIAFKQNEALGVLKDRATATGPSAWAQLMQQFIKGKAAEATDAAAAQGNAATAQGMSQLATRGGLSAAARERMASKGALNSLMARQKVGRDALQDELAMLAEDEKTKTNLLSTWGGLAESSAAREQNLGLANRDYATDVSKYNTDRMYDEHRTKQKFDMAKWQESMKALGAYQTARAQEEAGKK